MKSVLGPGLLLSGLEPQIQEYCLCLKQCLLVSLKFGNLGIHWSLFFLCDLFPVIFSPHLHIYYKAYVQTMKKKSHFFHVVFKTKGGNRSGTCGDCLSRWRIAMSGGERNSHFTINSDHPERSRQWGGQWSINRQNKDCRDKTESERVELKWTWSELRELNGVRNPTTQPRAGRIQNQILQVLEAPSYGWSMCWFSVQPPAHEHQTVFMLGFPPPGN